MEKFLVQKDGKVVEWTEAKLRRVLRAGDLSGVELARPPGEDRWRPLHELALFRDEVPHEGDPRDVARQRVVRGFAWHALAFAAVSTFWFGIVSIPAAIWAVFVIGHAARALPLALELFRERKLFGLPGSGSPRALPPSEASSTPTPVPALAASDCFAASLTEVRGLLARRPKEIVAPVLAELDRIATTVAQLREKIARLAELTGPEQRNALAERMSTAEAALADAGDSDDRDLLTRRLEVLRERERSAAQAQRTLDRLRIRESLAEEQVEQLRVDLVRAEAEEIEPDDLGSRLEQIRLEAEAAEEVEGLLAR